MNVLRRNLWAGLVPILVALAVYHDIPAWFLGQAAAVGFAGGLAGGLIAGAIGLVSVPLITLFLGLPIHVAAGTNLFQTIFTAATGAAAHSRLGNVNYRLAAPLLFGALFGAPAGSMTSVRLSADRLQGLFSVILLLMAANLLLRMVRPPTGRPAWIGWFDREAHGRTWFTRPIEGEFRGHTYRVSPVLATLLGGAIGFVSGLLGIGGGFLATPLVATFLHVPTHLAIGTGLVVISGNSLFGAAAHYLSGNVLVTTGLALAVGGSIGAKVGSRMSHHLPERALFGLFTVVLLVVAWRMWP